MVSDAQRAQLKALEGKELGYMEDALFSDEAMTDTEYRAEIERMIENAKEQICTNPVLSFESARRINTRKSPKRNR